MTAATRERIVVVRALALGDFLCAVPALRALRAAHPDARISLIGLARTRELVHRFRHIVDELVDFPGFPGIPETDLHPENLPAFLARSHAARYDLAVNLHGDGTTSNAFVALLGARRTAGFLPATGWRPTGDGFIPYPADRHEIHRNLALIEHLDAGAARASRPAPDDRLEFPLAARDRDATARLLTAGGIGRDYVVLHPGASTPARRWPVEDFAVVADTLAAMGHRIVLTGHRGERALTAAVAERMRARAVDLAGGTDLGTLGGLLERARLVVTNDTGVAHVTVGVGTPSVVIFTGSDRARWAPLDGRRHVAIGAGIPDAFLAGGAGAGPVAVPDASTPPRRAEVLEAAARLLAQDDVRAA